MKSARSKLPAIVLIAVVIGAIGVPTFVGQIHVLCAPKQHECGTTAKITSCCCDDQGEASNQTGPAEPKTQVNPHPTFAPAVFASSDASSLYRATVRSHTSPPRASPLDLPTLFASLLI